MKKILFLIFSVILFAKECYSILAEVNEKTPVSSPPAATSICPYIEEIYYFDTNKTYIGCFKTKQEAEKFLKKINFPIFNPKIVFHKIKKSDNFLVLPEKSSLKKEKYLKKLLYAYKKYTPKNIEKIIDSVKPGTFKVKIIDIKQAYFIPFGITYYFHKYNTSKIAIIYSGSTDIEHLQKRLPKYISKFDKNTYLIKIPIYISPTASLIIKNKKIFFQSKPNAVFLAYAGNIFAKNSIFSTWDSNNFKPEILKNVPIDKLLLFNTKPPRPFILGLAFSKSYFLNNTFKYLGYHGKPATFGVSLLKYSLYDQTSNIPLVQNYISTISPKGIYIGNNFEKNLIGFYSNNANNTILLGNYFSDNLIYNIDPHDFSNGLIIARNITKNAKHAHGIVISREVDNTIIAQNISFENHLAGIMLDRNSKNNFLYNNLTFLNNMGITIQESSNNFVYKNISILNKKDGILIRNSLNIDVVENNFSLNGKNGIESFTKDLSKLTYRNILRDPYVTATSSNLLHNIISKNLHNQILIKNSAAVNLNSNIVSGNNLFEGDLNQFLNILINSENFNLKGRGFPFMAIPIDKIIQFQTLPKNIENVIKDITKYNEYSDILLLRYYANKNPKTIKQKLLKASYNLIPEAIEDLGIYYFSLYQTTQKKIFLKKALVYYIQAAVLGDTYAQNIFNSLQFFFKMNSSLLNESKKIAFSLMSQGKIFYKEKLKLPLDKRIIVKRKFNAFKYKLKLIHKDIFEYFKIKYANFNIFTPQRIQSFEENVKEGNIKKKIYFKKQKKLMKLLDSNKECKKLLIKNKENEKEILKILKSKKFKSNALYKEFIKKVNEFRKENIIP